jgi:hypothetical protein
VSVSVQGTACKVSCWHADMTLEEIVQTGRMFQEGNFLSATDAAQMTDLKPPSDVFTHPDEVRGLQHLEVEEADRKHLHGEAGVAALAQVLVATDAALKNAPEVRNAAPFCMPSPTVLLPEPAVRMFVAQNRINNGASEG